MPTTRPASIRLAACPERHRGFLAAPRGILKIRLLPHPFRGRKPLFSPLSVARCQCAPFGHVGCSRVLHRFPWFLGFPRESPACPNVLVGSRSLSDALFGSRQKVIRRAPEDISHLLKAIGWDGGTALVQAQACLATAQSFCELILSHADAASLRCDVIHRLNLLSN